MEKQTPRLTVEMVPGTCHFSNLRSNLSKKDWDTLRAECFRLAGHRCQVCGGRGATHAVECHEVWEYDDAQRLQTLTGLMALCPVCHKAKHMWLARQKGWADMAERQLCRVNGWSRGEMEAYLDEAFRVYELRSTHEWQLDISWLEGMGVTLPGILDREN
jgi:hypothetical protein